MNHTIISAIVSIKSIGDFFLLVLVCWSDIPPHLHVALMLLNDLSQHRCRKSFFSWGVAILILADGNKKAICTDLGASLQSFPSSLSPSQSAQLPRDKSILIFSEKRAEKPQPSKPIHTHRTLGKRRKAFG